MRVKAGFVGQDLLSHELGGSLAEQPLLIAQILPREQEIRVQ